MKTTRLGILALLVACKGADPAAERPVETLDGRVTWSLAFVDGETCTYSRTYTATEDRSAPWLCPECDTIWRADVVLEGRDCHQRISDEEPATTEWIGTDGTTWYRSSRANGRLQAQGPAVYADGGEDDGEAGEEAGAALLLVEAEASGTDEEGAAVELTVSGSLALGDGLGDPLHGWRAPDNYSCGWPKADPPPYEGDWTLAKGETLPDGWFLDRCMQPVRLHDFQGRYLVIDIAASDCPPCQAMAREERGFVDGLRRVGLDVEVVTLLAPSLGGVIDPTPASMVGDWTTYFDLHSPVLGDRGWGYYLGNDALGARFAYPTSIVVAPDLTVLDISVGFGGWDYHSDLIAAHAGR